MQNASNDLKLEEYISKFVDNLFSAVDRSVPLTDIISTMSRDAVEITEYMLNVIGDASKMLVNITLMPVIDAIKIVSMANFAIGIAEGVYVSTNVLIAALRDAYNFLMSILNSQLESFNKHIQRFSLMLHTYESVQTQ